MEKDLTHEEIVDSFSNTTKTILEKQCEWVGITLDDIDLAKQDWYIDYSWTEEEREAFEDWMVRYLKENDEARRAFCQFPNRTNEDYLYKVAGRNSLGWTYNYGWTQEEYS